jgi:hypothetical protein
MGYMPEVNHTGGHQSILNPWAGSKGFATITGSNDRGLHDFNGVTYKVSDQTLYSVTESGVETSIGTIAGSNRCVMEDGGGFLVITTGSKAYQYDGTTLTDFTANFPVDEGVDYAPGNSVAMIDIYAVYDTALGDIIVSQPASDGTLDPDSLSASDTANSSKSFKDVKRVWVFDELLYMMGSKFIETLQVSSTQSPPFAIVRGGTMSVGLKDLHSVANTINFTYFRGSDGMVHRFSSTQPENVTSGAMANVMEAYADDTAVAYTISIQGGDYYVINFENNNETYAFSEKNHALGPGVDDWFSLSTGADKDIYIGAMYVKSYNKHLIAKRNSGDILELDLTVFTDDGDNVVRQRTLAPINGGLIGEEGARLMMSWFEIVFKKGVGLPAGQGSNPKAFVQFSFDGADSFTNEADVELGRTGESRIRIRVNHTESFYDLVARVTVYDPIFASIQGASIGLKVIGS